MTRCAWCGTFVEDPDEIFFGEGPTYCGRECADAAHGITTKHEQRGER